MSYCDILFTTSNISYNLQLPIRDIARLSNFLTTQGYGGLLWVLYREVGVVVGMLAISKGAFALKKLHIARVLTALFQPMGLCSMSECVKPNVPEYNVSRPCFLDVFVMHTIPHFVIHIENCHPYFLISNNFRF